MKSSLCCLLVCVSLLVAGCATTVNTVSRAEPLATPTAVVDRRVVTDQSLDQAIRIVGVNEGSVSGNLKRVQVTLENLKTRSRVIGYRFEWIDQDGMASARNPETWKQVRLAGGETVMVSSVASTPRAVDFVLKLIESK